MEGISANNKIFTSVLESYKSTESFSSSRIRQDLNSEHSTKRDYCGREIYELLQNAEDAQSQSVEIVMNTEARLLSISNNGENCLPFSEEGFCSIMMAGMSPKQIAKQSFIGHKGLGFRSLLNWAETIRIYSSGVCCEFSSAIVWRYWENVIKQSLSPELVKAHEEFAVKLKLDHPMSILATPEVAADDSQNSSYITKIEIVYKSECADSIREQISSLSGKVLLFLTNISEINIDIDGHHSRIYKKTSDKDSKHVTVYDSSHPTGIEYIIDKDTNKYEADPSKKYEICIAYTKDADKCGNYIYTFFPTKVRIGLPCVIHATFDLNSSRNSLIESEENKWMQTKIAQFLKKFTEDRAKEDVTCSWEYLKMIMLNEHDKMNFPLLAQELDKGLADLHIYPTNKGYLSLRDSLHYSSSFAKYVSEHRDALSDDLLVHLIEGFEDFNIAKQVAEDDFIDTINSISRDIHKCENEISKRAELILSISEIEYCTTNEKKLVVLTDTDGELIDGDAKNNVGENIEHLPEAMPIRYINDSLVQKLLKLFTISDSNIIRGLTAKLKSCGLRVDDMDISKAKEEIIKYLNRPDLTNAGFEKLMYALFCKLQNIKETSSLKDLFIIPQFMVIAKDNSRHYPSEVVMDGDDIYDSSEVLLHSAREWTEIFSRYAGDDGIKEEEVRNFFYDDIGISRRVPMNYVPIDYTADDYLNNYTDALSERIISSPHYFYSSTIEDGRSAYYNRFGIVKAEFISRLNDRGMKLADIVRLIISDKKVMKQLNARTINFKQHNVKYEDVDVSYPLYRLREHAVFKPLSTYIISERILLSGDAEMEADLNELAKDAATRNILFRLGARENISDLSVSELYQALKLLPDKKLKKGVQKLYKAIREAINSKISDEEFKSLSQDFHQNGTAYCRMAGGELTVKPVKDIYYWDNDLLPQNILKTKYKLELPTRVGEESVKNIFGINLAKDIQIEIRDNNENRQLALETMNRISERIRYILAYRWHNSREISDMAQKTQTAQLLKNISIHIYSKCQISVDNDSNYLDDGDMVSTSRDRKQTFHVCTGMTDVDMAFKTPAFCESITEILCITLKVISTEMANCFRSILKNSIEENEFIARKEISPEIWDDVDRAMGLSKEEKEFWNMVAAAKGNEELTKEQLAALREKKRDFLLSEFPGIVLPEGYTEVSQLTWAEKHALLMSIYSEGAKFNLKVLSDSGLYPYYHQYIESRILGYKNSVSEQFYAAAADKKDPELYCRLCDIYMNGEWVDTQIRAKGEDFLSDDDLDRLFIGQLKGTFSDIDLEDLEYCKPQEIRPLQSYLDILNDNGLLISNIDRAEVALTYFEGFEDKFREKIKTYSLSLNDSKSANDDDIKVESLSFSYGVATNKSKKAADNGANAGKDNGGGYISEKARHRAGLAAEKKVLAFLRSRKDLFDDIIDCSRNLHAMQGRDSLHYDIKYSIVENGVKGPERYLEVKSMSSDTILMSKAEHKFAIDNAKVYDLAIVKGDSITILRSPFDSGSNSKLEAIPETYSITMEIKDINS